MLREQGILAHARDAGQEWGVTEDDAFILPQEQSILSMPLIYWTHKLLPKFYINSPRRNLSHWL